MTRDELIRLIADAHSNAPYDNEAAAPVIVDALWPVLEQVWEEGYKRGFHYGAMDGGNTPNPYGEMPV